MSIDILIYLFFFWCFRPRTNFANYPIKFSLNFPHTKILLSNFHIFCKIYSLFMNWFFLSPITFYSIFHLFIFSHFRNFMVLINFKLCLHFISFINFINLKLSHIFKLESGALWFHFLSYFFIIFYKKIILFFYISLFII